MATKKSTAQPGGKAPKQRTCGAMQQHYHLLETNPTFRRNQLALEHASQARLRSAVAARSRQSR